MTEQTLKFNNIKVNKKEFHKSKQEIDLSSVIIDQIVVSDKFKHGDDGFKYFIGYQKNEAVKPLCIILPQMSGYIKYFENGGKNMSFMIKNDEVLEKYNEIWNVIKNKIGIKFHSEPIYDQTHIKTKVREFDGVIKTNFLGNGVPKENMHYTCIACVTIDSVMKMDKKYFPEVYLGEYKYKVKKIQISRFINAKYNDKTKKIRNFVAKEIIGYNNYGALLKILQMIFLVLFWSIKILFWLINFTNVFFSTILRY